MRRIVTGFRGLWALEWAWLIGRFVGVRVGVAYSRKKPAAAYKATESKSEIPILFL